MEKIPFITKEQATAIAAKYPTPFHIYDEKGIRANARAVQEAFRWEPGFTEYFAVKATPNPAIMQILMQEGCGFDCSSITELHLAEAVGARGEQIMFSSNETLDEEFLEARRLGAIINYDDITLIEATDALFGGDYPEIMSLRYNPGGVFTLSNGIMDNPGESKYGMTREQLFTAAGMLRDRGVTRLGIHAFLASNTVTNDYYPELAAQLFTLAAELAKETGIRLSFINLSGGVGIPYRPEETGNDIAVIGEGVRKAYEAILVPAGIKASIYTEMGRFMLGPYGALVTKAVREKHIYRDYVGVDACAAHLMRPAMYGAYHHITVLGKEHAPADTVVDVVGNLCENNDKFAVQRALPAIQAGDLLYIHDTGAHGYSMGYNYNGRLRSAELLLKEDGTVELIRRAETEADYFAGFDATPYGEKLKAILEGRA